MKRVPCAPVALIAAALLGAAVLPPAAAHAVLEPRSGAAGAYLRTAVTVGHGCDGSATVAVEVDIPPDIRVARPQPKPGWTVTVERQPLAQPFESHGRRVTERVSRVIWRGGPLPADQFDAFGLLLQLPRDAGRRLVRVRQVCEQGELDWHEPPAAPGAPRPRSPAAVLDVTAVEASTSPPRPPTAHHGH